MPQIKFAKQPHAADEVIDVWTGIWADSSQMAVSLPKNGVSFFFKRF